MGDENTLLASRYFLGRGSEADLALSHLSHLQKHLKTKKGKTLSHLQDSFTVIKSNNGKRVQK